jgi:type IV secretory pathway VirB2 component (pilin)
MMTLSIPLTLRRYLPLVLTLGVMLALCTTGLSAQATPMETAASRLVDVMIRIAPYLATIAFVIGGILMAIGHHDAYSRFGQICMGACVALGALSLVNYFRP